MFIGDCAVNGDYEDLPDELNQSKDNGNLAEEGEDDDLQVWPQLQSSQNYFWIIVKLFKIAGRRWAGEWNKAAQWENHQKGDSWGF